MPKARPVKSTGGAGFTFEDQTGAFLAAALLAGASPLDQDLGPPTGLVFQTGADGWRLDDILIAFDGGVRWCASVKSFRQIDSGAAIRDFVTRAWEEVLGASQSGFDPARDLIGMITAPVDFTTWGDLQELIRLAREQEPTELAARVLKPGYISKRRLKLWLSFERPAALAPAEGRAITTSPGEVLRLLRPLQADFEFSPSQTLGQARKWCQDALVDSGNAAALWEALLKIVATARTAGGTITWPILREKLNGRFDFRDHPSYERDWATLHEATDRNLGQISDSLSGRVHVDRTQDLAELEANTATARFIGLVGPSGCGKSALAKHWSTGSGDSVIWLQPDDAGAYSGMNTPLQHPLREVLRAATRPGWIVVDGLDRCFSDTAYQGVAQLVIALRDDPEIPFRLIITSQQQEWARVTDNLANRNAIVDWRSAPAHPFGDDELKRVYESFPALRDIALRGGLTGVLRIPKVLDVIVRRLTGGDGANSSAFSGDESRFASWFWERFALGTGPGRAARATLLQQLAQMQGDHLQADTRLIEFGPGHVERLDDVVLDGVCEVHDGRVRFAHDLYGDWARLELLRAHAEGLPAYISPRIASPVWHRAIRLHALGLLAGTTDPRRWSDELERLGGSEPGLLHDLFLEASLFAADPQPALETLWPALIQNGGQFLRRLLRRFLHSATVANPIIIATLRDVDADLETHAATMQRIPFWPLWLPVLAVIARHEEDALNTSLEEVAQMVDTWLRYTPHTWPMRKEAATIAIAIGRRTLNEKRAGSYGRDKTEAQVWRALLSAVHERPDDVENIAMTLCGRAEESTEVNDRTDDTSMVPDELDDEEMFVGPQGRRRPTVDRGFRELCLESDALHPVIGARPDLAAKVLLAMLLPSPRRPNSFIAGRIWNELGMDRMPGWIIPLYTRGPFLAFLRMAPREACEMILGLTDAATDRWAEIRAAEGEPVTEVEIQTNAGARRLRGDGQVFQWHRGDSRVPGTLASALMALEKWLYDEDDAGRDIGPVVGELLDRTGSVAIAGLLVAIGCRRHDLFRGPLRPLLGVAELHLWDLQYKSLEQTHLLIGLFRQPAQFRRLAEDWYSLEHRQVFLEDVGHKLLVTAPELEDFFAEVRERWQKRLDHGDELRALSHLAARFDRANWQERTHAKGLTYLEYVPPDELRLESEAAKRTSDERGFWLMMPMRCREIIDRKADVPDEALEGFWETAQARIGCSPPRDLTDGGVFSREDTECGVAAVLVVRHRDWLRRHPDRERWCRNVMLEAVEAEHTPREFDSAGGGIDWSWDAFCADALPLLWCEQPGDSRLRSAIARLALNVHRVTVAHLFASAARVRARLADDFERLQNLEVQVAKWRALRAIARDNAAEIKSVDDALTQRLGEFATRTLPATMPAWSKLAVPETTGRRSRWVELDVDYVQAAYDWMPPLGEARDAEERAAWVRYWRESVETLIRRLRRDVNPRDGEVEGTPYEYEYTLLHRVESRILEMTPEEARTIWEPILALGHKAHYWIETFLDSWFLTGLRTVPATQAFVREWKAMLEYVETCESWTPGRSRFHLSEHRRLLMGMGSLTLDLWVGEQATVVALMAPSFERWARHHITDDADATQLARFLRRPGATSLLPQGLIWLDAADSAVRARGADDDYDDALGSLMAHISRHHREIPRGSDATSAAYRRLLQHLAERQIPVAMELISRLSSSA